MRDYSDSTDSLNTQARYRVLIADDHRIVAEGIKNLLVESYELLAIITDGPALLCAITRDKPDLVVSDVDMPGCSGLDVLKQVREDRIWVPFIFLSMHAEPGLVGKAMSLGASGYVVKHSAGEELITAIHHVLRGGTYVTPSLGARFIRGYQHQFNRLTSKQQQILRLVARGLRSKQIADDLGISVRTVEAHKYTMMQILDVHSTLELVRRSEDLGLMF